MPSLLKNRMTAAEAAEKKRQNEIKKEQSTMYSADGRQVRPPFYRRFLWLIILAAVLCVLAIIIYVPPLFYSETDNSSQFVIKPDSSAINTYQAYLKDNPEADFDNDGLSNSLENEHGTSIWSADTDGDGVNDFAELFITDTSPIDATTVLVDYTKESDQFNDESLDTPYKIDDIIFWPDSYLYKALGNVVRTPYGYRFCNYKGWVKFPQTVYAYKYVDGIHYELEQDVGADAWYINSSDEILLYGSPLSFVYCLKIPIVGTVYLSDGMIGRIFDTILPDKGGIFTCHREAAVDVTQSNSSDPVTAEIAIPDVDIDNVSRFGNNTNSLSDLSYVWQKINAGKCVAVSLYSSNVGEVIGLIYGYDASRDTLLVADLDLNPVGEIYITEMASRCMNEEGTVEQISWFEWKGLGYDSQRYGDRISFITITKEEAEEASRETEPQYEIQTEPETEPPTEPETEAQTEMTETESETQTELANDTIVTFNLQ